MLVFQIVPPLAAGICFLNHRQGDPARQVDQVTLIGTAIICAIGVAITIATCPNNILQGLIVTFIPSFVYRVPLALYNFLKPVVIKHGEQSISTFSSLPMLVTRVFSSITKVLKLITDSLLTGLWIAGSFLGGCTPNRSGSGDPWFVILALLMIVIGTVAGFFYSLVTTPILLLEIPMAATLIGVIGGYNSLAPESIKTVIKGLLIFEALCMAMALPAVPTEKLLTEEFAYPVIGLFTAIILNAVWPKNRQDQPPAPT